MAATASTELLSPETRAFYVEALHTLNRAAAPFLVGGAYAFARYTGIERHTKDFDIFIREKDLSLVIKIFERMGCLTEPTFPHWLSKAYKRDGGDFIDIIFSAGNGIATVDDLWFQHSVEGTVFDVPIRLIPPEEMIWSKSFIMERERYDGADVAHILREYAEKLDYDRLLMRFGGYWRVLLAHFILFGFIYPSERSRIPAAVIEELIGRLQAELNTADRRNLCQGTLISRQQYLIDVTRFNYQDARQEPRGHMSKEDIAHWTAAIKTID
jgi:hypothetical protein